MGGAARTGPPATSARGRRRWSRQPRSCPIIFIALPAEAGIAERVEEHLGDYESLFWERALGKLREHPDGFPSSPAGPEGEAEKRAKKVSMAA